MIVETFLKRVASHTNVLLLGPIIRARYFSLVDDTSSQKVPIEWTGSGYSAVTTRSRASSGGGRIVGLVEDTVVMPRDHIL